MLDYFSKNMFPPGFRFHPTDEELVLYYLKKKICRKRILLDAIAETDVYKWDPQDLPDLSKLKTGDRQWFFFSPRDRKYPNGARGGRSTKHGYWKVTGRDRTVTCNSRAVGVKKTLVFHKGRAPVGERTDWVMHEYTMDEEELKRCQDVQDYFALYKVFKKSGAGPKNGEQYGAPFSEEDWDNDECPSPKGFVHEDGSTKQVNEVPSVDDARDELLNHTANEPVLVEPLSVDYGYAFEQLVHEEDTESALLNPSTREVSFPYHSAVIAPSCQQYNVKESLDMTVSGTSQLQLHEAPEVTSAPVSHEQQRHVVEEDFREDFLEMNDLGPEPNIQNFDNPELGAQNFDKAGPSGLNFDKFTGNLEGLQVDYLDGLTEFELYHDWPLLLDNIGTTGVGQITEPHVNNFVNGLVNPVPTMYLSTSQNELVNNQLMHLNDGEQTYSQLWTYDQRFNTFNPTEANQFVVPPATSGVVYDSNLANHPMGANQNQIATQDDGTTSWFSSQLWAFVDSIPTTPAAAAESPLGNGTFKRMSSFSRVRINTKNTNVVADNTSATSSRLGKSKNGVIYFSFVGLLCAILCLLAGTFVEVLGRHLSS